MKKVLIIIAITLFLYGCSSLSGTFPQDTDDRPPLINTNEFWDWQPSTNSGI